jgi:hypothetical protein
VFIKQKRKLAKNERDKKIFTFGQKSSDVLKGKINKAH